MPGTIPFTAFYKYLAKKVKTFTAMVIFAGSDEKASEAKRRVNKMKNTKETFLCIGLALMLLTVVPGIQIGVLGQGEFIDREVLVNARHSRIVGIWDVQVTVRNCSTGVIMSTFPALHKFELGGTGQVVSGTNPTSFSAHMSIWENVGKDDYQMAVKMYRYDGAGNNIGTVVLRNNINISNDVYTGSGVTRFYDVDGNEVGISCPTLEGIRFQ